MMALRDFDDLTDEAFAFLREDFGYQAEPTKVGGRFRTACVREFIKDDLRICLCVGEADSSHFCSIVFVDSVDAKVDSNFCTYHNLAALLEDRLPEFHPPSLRDLPTRSSQIEAIRTCASLLRDFAHDAIGGDFSAFPTYVSLNTSYKGDPQG